MRTTIIPAFLAFLLLASAFGFAQEPPAAGTPASAAEVLDRCLRAVGALESYRVTFSNETATPELPTLTTGRLAVAPGRRVRYEVATQRGKIEGRIKRVADGSSVWRLDEFSPEATWQYYSVADMDAVLTELSEGKSELDLNRVQELRKDLEIEHGFRGILPTLEDLKAKLEFTRVEQTEVRQGDRPARAAWLLHGVWNKAVRTAILPPKQAPPPPQPGQATNRPQPEPIDPAVLFDSNRAMLFYPRRARLYVDRDSYLPVRVEWLGPKRASGPDEVLVRADWLDLQAQPVEALAGDFQLTAEERGQPSQPMNFQALMRQRVDFLVQQQKRERELELRGERLLQGAGQP